MTQPKKQELPPLDDTYGLGAVPVADALGQRERQLLAALSDNEAQEKAFQVVNNLVIAKCTQVKELYEEITALSAKLKSVEGMLEEKLDWSIPAVREMVRARIREAIK